MADDGGDLGVHQLLRHGGADLGVGLVVFGDEAELHLLAVDQKVGEPQIAVDKPEALLALELAGRDDQLAAFDVVLQRVAAGRPATCPSTSPGRPQRG